MSRTAAPECVIRRGEAYPKEVFLAKTKLKRDAYYAAVRDGLRVSKKHGRVYVTGDAWLDYLATESEPVSTDAETPAEAAAA